MVAPGQLVTGKGKANAIFRYIHFTPNRRGHCSVVRSGGSFGYKSPRATAMIFIMASTYRQCSQYLYQYIDHLAVPTTKQTQTFFR